MAEIFLIRRGDIFAPANPEDLDAMRKIPAGRMVKAEITQPRNAAFLRKAFSLMRMSFEHWQPDTVVSKIERDTVVRLGKFMTANGMSRETAFAFCKQFMERLNSERETYEAERSFEAFRDWLTVQSGFYRVVHTPSGMKKEPRSISFGKMTEEEFAEYYKAIFSVCWRVILSKSFGSEAEAQIAVDQLLSFD